MLQTPFKWGHFRRVPSKPVGMSFTVHRTDPGQTPRQTAQSPEKWKCLAPCVCKDLTQAISEKVCACNMLCSREKTPLLSLNKEFSRCSTTLLYAIPIFKKPSQVIKIQWKQRQCQYNCAQWAPNIKLLFSSMAFITLSASVVYMIIYYLLFRRERVPYKMNDFNRLINKTWINVLVK